MSAGRSAVIERVNQASPVPVRMLQHLSGSLLPRAALLGLAAILFLSRGSGVISNLGAVTLLKCGLLTGTPAQASACPSLDPWSSFAPPLLRGVLAYQSADGYPALRLFEQARAARPSDPLAAFWLASANHRSGNNAEAILSWRTLGPRKMALFFRNRSKDALESGDVTSALDQAQIAVDLDPACGEASLQLGNAYFLQGDLENAGGALRQAARLELSAWNRGAAYHVLGEIDRSLGLDKQALDEYRLAVNFAPGNYLFRRDLADQHARLHQYPEAKALLTDLLAGSPSDASLQVRMGNLFLEQNEYREAERWYQAAVSAAPGSGAGEAALGRLFRQKGDLDMAAAFFEQSIQLNPDNDWVSASLGGIYWQQGRLNEATTAYAWVTARSQDPLLLEDSWLSLAQLYALTGKRDLANSAWRTVLEINPENRSAREALHRNP